MSRILFVSSEAYPLIKTGGLADVAGSLPPALLKQSQDIRILLPAYPEALSKIRNGKIRARTSYYDLPVEIIETRLPGTKVIALLVDCPSAFHRPGGPYTDPTGEPWHDNALRFAVFCQVAVDIALNRTSLNWQPELVHCNDWQSGLVPALLSMHKKRPATVFTIHNLAYQGVYDRQTYVDLDLPEELWHMDGLEYYGNFSFIKGGIAFADRINAVSPNYAREILEPGFGCGLEHLLQHRTSLLSGILNGIDHKYWNPGTDEHLVQKYNRRSITKKSLNKLALQKELSLPVNEAIPMIGMVSRLVQQKGLDQILEVADDLLGLPVQFVVLGTGELHYEMQLNELARRHPDRLKVIIGYDESQSHRIEAASDLFLMPSTFEPCGLNQLYSLRYGTLPIVTKVGGLADTVVDANRINQENGTANGFVLEEISATALLKTVKRALALYQEPEKWKQLQFTAMAGEYSWQSSAEHYLSLYKLALDQRSSAKKLTV